MKKPFRTNNVHHLASLRPPQILARVLQADDPDLTVADQIRLGSNANVVVLAWRWRVAQRLYVPRAREFRIYIRGDAPMAQVPRDGSARQLKAWKQRVGVVPIGTREGYEFILRNRLLLDADHPYAQLWVGVSTADDQSHVDDKLDATLLNGGRPGGESATAAVVAIARYQGRRRRGAA